MVNIDNEEYFEQLQDIFRSEECSTNNKRQSLLFHIVDDPYEKHDLSETLPEIVKKLESALDKYEKGMIPPDVTDLVPTGNPVHFGNAWSTGWCSSRPH